MGSVHAYKTANGRMYQVRYRKPDNSQAGKRGFRTKREAEKFLASVSVSITQGGYVDPADSRVSVAELGREWLADQAAVSKPSSMHRSSQPGAYTSSPSGGDTPWDPFVTAMCAHGSPR